MATSPIERTTFPFETMMSVVVPIAQARRNAASSLERSHPIDGSACAMGQGVDCRTGPQPDRISTPAVTRRIVRVAAIMALTPGPTPGRYGADAKWSVKAINADAKGERMTSPAPRSNGALAPSLLASRISVASRSRHFKTSDEYALGACP